MQGGLSRDRQGSRESGRIFWPDFDLNNRQTSLFRRISGAVADIMIAGRASHHVPQETIHSAQLVGPDGYLSSRRARRHRRAPVRLGLRGRHALDEDHDSAAGVRHPHQFRADRDRDSEPQLSGHRGAVGGAGAQLLPPAPDAAAGPRREEIGQQRPVDGMAEAVHDRAQMQRGEMLFYKDEKAEEMLYIVSGRFRLVESGIELPVGAIVGELGMLSPSNVRTQSLECIEGRLILASATARSRNSTCRIPAFGFYFLGSPARGCSRTSASSESGLREQTAPASAGRSRPDESEERACRTKRPVLAALSVRRLHRRRRRHAAISAARIA